MIIDLAAAAGDLSLDTDICVIGGGAAGTAIAWYFRHVAGREVTVLEGGGIELDDASQDLNKGTLSGKPYFDLDVTRLRMLGGNTNHWANQVAPFEDIDFEHRPWIAHSGWPIRRSDIDPWYPGALEYLQLGREDLADYLNWGADVPALAAIDPPGGVVVSKPFLRHVPPLSVGSAYLGMFETSRNLRLVLNANVTNLGLSADRTELTVIEAKALNGRTVKVRPRQVVLAAGGIENARLLLANRDAMPNGIGNDRDLVGRFFMDHLRITSGAFIPAAGIDLVGYDDFRQADETGHFFNFRLGDEVQRDNEIGVVRFKFSLPERVVARDKDGGWGLRGLLGGRNIERLHAYVADIFLDGEADDAQDRSEGALACVNVVEQTPNPDSRITLTDDRDALGMQRIELHWALTGQERHTLRRSQELFGDSLPRRESAAFA